MSDAPNDSPKPDHDVLDAAMAWVADADTISQGVIASLIAEVERLRLSIKWRCRECGCAFPDHPHPEWMESEMRCSQCVWTEIALGQRDDLQAEVERLRKLVPSEE